MKKLIILFLVFSIYCQIPGITQDNDPILLIIGNNKITKSEFERIYKKNNAIASADKKSVKDYLELFINYKLKVIEAERLGYDTVKSFEHELAGYRDQLAKPYLEDREITDELLKEAYERSRYEINASHILVKVDQYALPDDTLAAYNKIMDIRRRIVSGESFEKVAKATSDDPSAKMNGGELGWFSVFRMVYPFETAAYNTPVGEVSMPVRSRFGYHIIKVNGKRPARGDIKVAHIMVLLQRGASKNEVKNAKEKIEKYYQMLKGGADFSAIAKKYSEDSRSAPEGGEMKWFRSGSLPPEFENVAYDLKNVGDISAPVRTDYGWHIIKLLGKKPIGSFEVMKPELKRKLERDSRSKLADNGALERIEKENNFVEYPQNLNILAVKVDTSIYSNRWNNTTADTMSEPLFTINGKLYLQKDFAAYLKSVPKPSANIPVRLFVETVYKDYINKSVTNYEKAHLEDKYPEFKNLMQEYHDGILLFNLTNDTIWDKAEKDSAGLEKFYQVHKNEYMWDKRLDAAVYTVHDSTLLTEARKLAKKQLKKGFTNKTYLNELCPYDSIPCVEIKDVKVQKDNNEYDWINKIPWERGLSENFRSDDGMTFVAVKSILPPQPKALDEARGIITSDYQKFLEDRWIKRLRSEYKITVDGKVLETIE